MFPCSIESIYIYIFGIQNVNKEGGGGLGEYRDNASFNCAVFLN